MRSVFATTAFRTAALSAVVYAMLTGLLIAAVYPLVAEQINAEMSSGIAAESSALASLYGARGVGVLTRVVHTRSNAVLPTNDDFDADDPGRRYYALTDNDNHMLAGDLQRWPGDAPARGWTRFRFRHHTVRALITPLPGGEKLLVGQSLAIPDALGRNALLLIVSGFVVALLAGLGGGVFIGARVMRRIRESADTAALIAGGHLEERLATGGSGEHEVLARSFNAMLERIETTVLSLRNLSARTAHEIRHPLTRMEQILSQAENSDSLETVQVSIHVARDQISELARRTEAVLRLARLESDHERRKFFSEFDLAKLVTDVVELYAPTAEEQNHSMPVSTAGTSTFFGDKQLLAQALANLLDNAIRYARTRATIEITMQCADRQITINVKNGIDSALGESFNTLSSKSGNNMGIPIVRAIAQLHHGQLVTDDLSGYFVARLVLPVSRQTF
ncbi:MAG: sensor histidine kinase [Gammaproteobacteria bacterium]